MRIGINCRELLSHRMEGIARYTYETTRQMVLDHPEDDFFFFFDRKYDPQFIFADNITPVVIPPQARHPILWYLWFEYSITWALKKHNIDVFYSGDTYLSLKTNVPTLLISHDIAYAHYPEYIRKGQLSYYQKYFPKFHKKADHIVAVSEYTRQDIIKTYGLNPQKVTVGYNATPPGFKPLSSSERQTVRDQYAGGHPYFLFVGSLHPRKNITRLIRAFDRFKSETDNDYKLVLVGRFAWKNEELKDTYASITHKEEIILTGSIHKNIQSVVAGCSGLFYVSLFEGFGIPILEGFSSGIPVVTSNVSSMPEVAQDAAIIIDPTYERAISDTMIQLSKSPIDPKQIQKGLNRAKDFTWKRTADHIYEKLREVVL